MTRKATKTEAADETKPEVITSIKGLDHEFKCRGHQFEIGKTYSVEGKVLACSNGFHAVDADNPFHVWDFYPIIDDEGRLSRYAEVEQSGSMDREKEHRGTKIASASITIKAELSLPDFVKRAVKRLVESTTGKGDGPRSDFAQIGSSGDFAQIGSSGDSARIGSSGDSAQIGSSGHSARIGSSGHSAQIGSSGHSAQIGSSGDFAQIGSSGDFARIGSSGHSAQIDASGEKAVVASAGINTRTKAKTGTWVSLAEFDQSSPPKCIGFASGCVGQDGIPADTWLIAKSGKLVPEA